MCAVQLEPSLSTPQLPALCNGSVDSIFESTYMSVDKERAAALLDFLFVIYFIFYFFILMFLLVRGWHLFSVKLPHGLGFVQYCRGTRPRVIIVQVFQKRGYTA